MFEIPSDVYHACLICRPHISLSVSAFVADLFYLCLARVDSGLIAALCLHEDVTIQLRQNYQNQDFKKWETVC